MPPWKDAVNDRPNTDTGRTDEQRVCAVCGRILNSYVPTQGERSWLHTFADLPEDHPAVPVRAAEGITPRPRCDFCSAEDPTWRLPVRSFVLPGLTAAPVDNGSHGHWAACDTCARLIDGNQWNALRRRALRDWTASSTYPDIDRQLAATYRLLRKNITGPLQPIPSPPTPHP